MASCDGVHTRLVVDTDCRVATLSEEYGIRRFVPGRHGETRPQVLLESGAGAERVLDPVVRTDEAVVCRLVPEELDACSNRCPAWGFGFLPVAPYNVRWQAGAVHLSIAADSGTELRTTLDRLDEEGFEVQMQRLATDDIDKDGRTAVVDLTSLTERQRTVATKAAREGYFDPDGPCAEAVAEDLDINKATLSEHLRTVKREFFRQTFADAT